jgi:SynChlorMet cassette radical SAM/SPASM protein ScmE
VEYDLPLGEWLEFFKELNQCAVLNVSLQGGEPFFRVDILKIIEGIVQNRMRFLIVSNGTLIDNDLAAFLNATGRCSGIQISIDGSTAETHDLYRGTGSFQKAIKGIKTLYQNNLPVSVRVTLHRQNVFQLESIASMLLEEMGLQWFSVNSVSYLGLCRQNSEELQLNIEEKTYAMETLLRLKKKYHGRITATSGPLAQSEKWLKMEKALREKKERFSNCGYLTGCNCVTNRLSVLADGTIVPCNLLGYIKLGRINQDNLEKTWQNHPALEKLRERCHIPLSDFEFCKECDYINYCTGNCPATAYTLLGNENHPAPDACLKRFLEAGGKLPDEKLLTKPKS